jgi:predicted alpha/beta superfamily hydrolase
MYALDAHSGGSMDDWEPYEAVYSGEGHFVSGDVRVLRGVAGRSVGARDLLVYLPPGYESSPERRYPVLYLHDGQNVFDAATSFAGEWGADETAETLAEQGLEVILVAIPNGGRARSAEYSPWTTRQHGLPRQSQADDFLAFVLACVMPRIDDTFRTSRLRNETGIAGSSLGALSALYACLARPGVFGFCGALSPAFWPGRGAIGGFARDHQDPGLRIYIDVGRAEAGDRFLADIRRMRDLLTRQGYDVAYVEDPDGQHNEESWRRRFPAMLAWFLDPELRPDRQ